ncbi:hypothetical protein DSL72_004135 [Monilinia vaccinii-corymbosi]|uniref:3'-5' exonuclease domain-containing protein n=1 Tax=Monilinia vaccinii-corymbosi TaxID=61207 RepID=A0A8A3P8J0_9HELO|nr:hypothetical protein DSL72_004135 [Monilinia vaccinii-corymbosi]
MRNVSSFIGKSNLAPVEAMGSAIAGMSGKMASPSVTRSISSNPPKTWKPSYGIVFKDVSTPGSPRLSSTVAVAGNELNSGFYSGLEGSCVLENSHVESSKTQTAATVASEEVYKAEEAADFQEIEDEIQEDPEKDKLPTSGLTYQMTEELFRQAKEATPETPGSFWSHTLYRGPEENGIPKKVKVHYCRSLQTTEQVLKQHFLGQKILGFDIEWKGIARTTDPAKHNVSLIQLATEERVGLFHIALFPTSKVSGLVAPTLKKIMEDPEVTKLGVAISADCTRLRKYLGIDSVSIFELSHLYRLVKYTPSQEYDQINKKLVSLATQVEEHLHLPLFKGGDVRSSDWSRALSFQQISYAASDSYAGIHLYDVLETKRQALNPVPPRPCFAGDNQPISKPTPSVPTPTSGSTPTSNSNSTPTKRKYTRRKLAPDLLPLDPEFSIGNPEPTLQVPLEAATKKETEIETEEKAPTPDFSINSEPSSAPVYDPEPSVILTAADVLVIFHFNAYPNSQIQPRWLRAYFIWYHNAHLSISHIAALLPDKRKSVVCVARYILSAIDEGDLPFDKSRLRELLRDLPKTLAWSNFRRLVEVVDQPDC